jgi:hypothetical protein
MMGMWIYFLMKGVRMFRKRSFLIIASVFLIPVLACNLSNPTTVIGTNPDPAAATAAIQTQVALLVASTSVAQTALSQSLADTQTAMPSNTPEFTFTPSTTPTPSSTPMPTFTLTPSIPTVTVSVNTNCRSGPTTSYDLLGILMVGETAQVVARSTLTDTMIIKLPSNPSIKCWLWAQNATVSGDLSKLPVIAVPPSPTPAASFTAGYVEKITCMGEYALTFKISNTGAITWESIKVVVTDTVTDITKTLTGDSFKRYNGCTVSGEDLNLEPGEVGYTSTVPPAQFLSNPAGHAMTAVITVCSKNGLAGTCLSKSVSFTP